MEKVKSNFPSLPFVYYQVGNGGIVAVEFVVWKAIAPTADEIEFCTLTLSWNWATNLMVTV